MPAAPPAKPPATRGTRILPEPPSDDTLAGALLPPDSGTLIQHPDGWYWLAERSTQQFGPFATADEALADMNAAADGDLEPGETLEEAEQELGMAGWVDPDTGELAEESHTRIEDH